MGFVWTHTDWFADGVCGGGSEQEGFLCVNDTADGDTTTWIEMKYLQQQQAACALKDIDIVVDSVELIPTSQPWIRRVEAIVNGKVVVCDYRHLDEYATKTHPTDAVKMSLQRVQILGAVGVVVIIADNTYDDESRRNALSVSLFTEMSIPIMYVRARSSGALTLPGAKLSAFPGAYLPSRVDIDGRSTHQCLPDQFHANYVHVLKSSLIACVCRCLQ